MRLKLVMFHPMMGGFWKEVEKIEIY